MHYTQQKHIKGVAIDDIYIGNGVSELIVMSMNALLNAGDEVLIPAPDYPLWTAAVSPDTYDWAESDGGWLVQAGYSAPGMAGHVFKTTVFIAGPFDPRSRGS